MIYMVCCVGYYCGLICRPGEFGCLLFGVVYFVNLCLRMLFVLE